MSQLDESEEIEIESEGLAAKALDFLGVSLETLNGWLGIIGKKATMAPPRVQPQVQQQPTVEVKPPVKVEPVKVVPVKPEPTGTHKLVREALTKGDLST